MRLIDVGGSIWQFLFQEKMPSCLKHAVVKIRFDLVACLASVSKLEMNLRRFGLVTNSMSSSNHFFIFTTSWIPLRYLVLKMFGDLVPQVLFLNLFIRRYPKFPRSHIHTV